MKNAMKTSNTDLVNEIWELLTLPELLVAAENASKPNCIVSDSI